MRGRTGRGSREESLQDDYAGWMIYVSGISTPQRLVEVEIRSFGISLEALALLSQQYRLAKANNACSGQLLHLGTKETIALEREYLTDRARESCTRHLVTSSGMKSG